MKEKRRIFGIDLGTTNSLVSFIKDENPRIVPNERGGRMTPSVVHFKQDGRIVFGEPAKNQAVLNAERTVSNIKLSMGGDRVILIGETEYTPEDISSLILQNLKEYTEKYTGSDMRDVVITVPAYFGDRQREATLKAAQQTGLNVLKLLNEPTAAALTYGYSEKQGTRLLVIDFGGGTLDITLMEYKDRVFRVRGVGGSTSIGGSELDRFIVDYIAEAFENTHGVDLKKDAIAWQQLIIHAEKAKIDLSAAEETRIMIPYITATAKGPIHLNTELTRDQFEKMITPVIAWIESHILQTFEQAQLPPEWVETVILVGGSTRLPLMETLVQRIVLTGSPEDSDKAGETSETDPPQIQIKRNINPDEAVARGAAILAGILEGSISGIEFHDITPHDLGVEDDEGRLIPILPKGTSYPVSARRLFTTTRDHEPEICIHVLQQAGMDENVRISLGLFRLPVDNSLKQGEPNIDVIFDIDANGLLHVSAVDLDSGRAEEIIIDHEGFSALKKGNPPDVFITEATGLKPIHLNKEESTNG